MRGYIDGVRGVAHAQARVAAVFREELRATPILCQEPGKALLGAFPVIIGVHWADDIVLFDLGIKAVDEALKGFHAANGLINRIHYSSSSLRGSEMPMP